MKMTPQLLRALYDRLTELQHPDPLSLLARIKVDTKFDERFDNGKGRSGFVGLKAADARRFKITNFRDVEGALEAAVVIDQENYEKVGNSVDRMFVTWRRGLKAGRRPGKFHISDRRWLGKIKAARKAIAQQIGLDYDATTLESEDDSDQEFRQAYSAQSYTVDKDPGRSNAALAFFTENQLDTGGDQNLVQSLERSVEIDRRERVLQDLIRLIDIA